MRGARPDEQGPLAAAHNAVFDDGWTAVSYRELVMRTPGYEARNEIVVADANGAIVAFATIWFDDLNRVGLFEPVGVHPDFRRRGLGLAVMSTGLDALRAAGMHTAVVEHDATNTAARALYERAGFATIGSTLGFRRGDSG